MLLVSNDCSSVAPLGVAVALGALHTLLNAGLLKKMLRGQLDRSIVAKNRPLTAAALACASKPVMKPSRQRHCAAVAAQGAVAVCRWRAVPARRLVLERLVVQKEEVDAVRRMRAQKSEGPSASLEFILTRILGFRHNFCFCSGL